LDGLFHALGALSLVVLLVASRHVLGPVPGVDVMAKSRAVFGWGEAVRFFFEREAPGLRKCSFHQNSTPASAISTRYRVGLGGVAFVPPGGICALLSGARAV
jgi:hypothetical protein